MQKRKNPFNINTQINHIHQTHFVKLHDFGCRVADLYPSRLGAKTAWYMSMQKDKRPLHSHCTYRNVKFTSTPHVHVVGMWEDARVSP